jgi:hypothetical protein
MISSVTNSLAALAELPAAPGETPGAHASVGVRSPPRLASSRGPAAFALAAGAAKAAKAAAAKPKPKPKAKATSTGAGYAKAASSTSKTAAKGTKASTAQKKAGPLGFLDDPKLSVEDKLLKLLAYLNDKWNKDLDAKMKEFKTEKEKATSSSSSSSSSKKPSGLGGLVGKAVGFAKQAFPAAGVALEALGSPAVRGALKSVAGPALAALATSTGFPQLAPAALKFGPDLVDAAAGLASSLGSGEATSPVAAVDDAVGGSGGGSGGSTSTTQTANPLGSDKDAQLKLMEIQRIMDQQKEMFSLVSNLLRSGHEGRMGIIQNLRA